MSGQRKGKLLYLFIFLLVQYSRFLFLLNLAISVIIICVIFQEIPVHELRMHA